MYCILLSLYASDCEDFNGFGHTHTARTDLFYPHCDPWSTARAQQYPNAAETERCIQCINSGQLSTWIGSSILSQFSTPYLKLLRGVSWSLDCQMSVLLFVFMLGDIQILSTTISQDMVGKMNAPFWALTFRRLKLRRHRLFETFLKYSSIYVGGVCFCHSGCICMKIVHRLVNIPLHNIYLCPSFWRLCSMPRLETQRYRYGQSNVDKGTVCMFIRQGQCSFCVCKHLL